MRYRIDIKSRSGKIVNTKYCNDYNEAMERIDAFEEMYPNMIVEFTDTSAFKRKVA